LPPTEEDEAGIRTARRLACQSWERLRSLPLREQTALVESEAEAGMRSWALAELLCHESARATADGRTQEALRQARLALRVAGLAPEGPSWRARLEGYAWGHLANALRSAGALNESEEGFRRAEKLWMEGAVSHPGPLDNSRVLRLEALLRRAQGRLQEGLELLDRVRHFSPTVETPVLQIQRGAFLVEAGRCDEAVEELRRTTVLLQGRLKADRCSPRLRLDLAFNLAVSLDHAGRHAELEPTLGDLTELAAAHGTDVDRTRVRWLAARAAAGAGRTREALAALGAVRSALAGHGLDYDAVLVTLETAALHAAHGDTAEVKELARGLAPLTQSAAVPRGGQATLKLFCRMAEKDGLTPESTRRFGEDFRRTGGDPSLRPEPWPELED